MALKKLIAGGFGTVSGTIIWECYSKGWAGVDWLKVGFMTLFVILVATLFSALPTKKKQEI